MNLHGLVSPLIGLVNPQVPATLYRSSGYATGRGGDRVPTYDAPQALIVQKQALTARDLQHVDMLNLQGEMTKIWMSGAVYGVVRKAGKGGDLLVFDAASGTPQIWLVVAVLEIWPDWCSVIAVLQLDKTVPQ